MFGLFKKAPQYPTECKWTVLQGEHEGRFMIVRRNDSAAQLRGHVEYRYRIGVAIPLKEPDERGLPSNEESSQLNIIEDKFTEALERDRQCLEVLVITTGGMREFVFYSRDAAAAKSILEANTKSASGHELQSYIAEDPDWGVYAQFA